MAEFGLRRRRQCCSDSDDGRSGVAPVFFMDKVMPDGGRNRHVEEVF